MSRSKHSDDSWRVWGEYRKERSLLKDFDNWKQEAREDAEDMSEAVSVYIIINEWESEDAEGTTLQEIVGSKYFETEDEAWEHLSYIAESHDVVLDPEDASFDLPDLHAVRNEAYYIQELTG